MATNVKQQARRLFDEAWNAGRLETIDEIVDPSYRGQDPLLGTIDRDGLKKSLQGYREAFPNLKFEVKEIICEGDTAVVRWSATGTNRGPLFGAPPTGKNATVGGLTLGEYRNGRLVRDNTQWDALGLFRQLGIEKMAPVGLGATPGVQPGKQH